MRTETDIESIYESELISESIKGLAQIAGTTSLPYGRLEYLWTKAKQYTRSYSLLRPVDGEGYWQHVSGEFKRLIEDELKSGVSAGAPINTHGYSDGSDLGGEVAVSGVPGAAVMEGIFEDSGFEDILWKVDIIVAEELAGIENAFKKVSLIPGKAATAKTKKVLSDEEVSEMIEYVYLERYLRSVAYNVAGKPLDIDEDISIESVIGRFMEQYGNNFKGKALPSYKAFLKQYEDGIDKIVFSEESGMTVGDQLDEYFEKNKIDSDAIDYEEVIADIEKVVSSDFPNIKNEGYLPIKYTDYDDFVEKYETVIRKAIQDNPIKYSIGYLTEEYFQEKDAPKTSEDFDGNALDALLERDLGKDFQSDYESFKKKYDKKIKALIAEVEDRQFTEGMINEYIDEHSEQEADYYGMAKKLSKKIGEWIYPPITNEKFAELYGKEIDAEMTEWEKPEKQKELADESQKNILELARESWVYKKKNLTPEEFDAAILKAGGTLPFDDEKFKARFGKGINESAFFEGADRQWEQDVLGATSLKDFDDIIKLVLVVKKSGEKATPSKQEIYAAYRVIVKEIGFSDVEIYELQQKLGIPMEDLHAFLLDQSRKGNAVLSAGDYSLSSPEVRAAGLKIQGRTANPLSPNNDVMLLVRFKEGGADVVGKDDNAKPYDFSEKYSIMGGKKKKGYFEYTTQIGDKYEGKINKRGNYEIFLNGKPEGMYVVGYNDFTEYIAGSMEELENYAKDYAPLAKTQKDFKELSSIKTENDDIPDKFMTDKQIKDSISMRKKIEETDKEYKIAAQKSVDEFNRRKSLSDINSQTDSRTKQRQLTKPDTEKYGDMLLSEVFPEGTSKTATIGIGRIIVNTKTQDLYYPIIAKYAKGKDVVLLFAHKPDNNKEQEQIDGYPSDESLSKVLDSISIALKNKAGNYPEFNIPVPDDPFKNISTGDSIRFTFTDKELANRNGKVIKAVVLQKIPTDDGLKSVLEIKSPSAGWMKVRSGMGFAEKLPEAERVIIAESAILEAWDDIELESLILNTDSFAGIEKIFIRLPDAFEIIKKSIKEQPFIGEKYESKAEDGEWYSDGGLARPFGIGFTGERRFAGYTLKWKSDSLRTSGMYPTIEEAQNALRLRIERSKKEDESFFVSLMESDDKAFARSKAYHLRGEILKAEDSENDLTTEYSEHTNKSMEKLMEQLKPYEGKQIADILGHLGKSKTFGILTDTETGKEEKLSIKATSGTYATTEMARFYSDKDKLSKVSLDSYFIDSVRNMIEYYLDPRFVITKIEIAGNKKVKNSNPSSITESSHQLDTTELNRSLLRTTEDGLAIYTVNGTYVRNKVWADFTQGGHSYVYPDFVPENEVWIDDCLTGNDREATIVHEVEEARQMRDNGLDYNSAHYHHAFPAEREFRASADAGELNKKTIGKREVFTLCTVSGGYVRGRVNENFTMGGNGYHEDYKKFIPKNEIWIDEVLNETDREATIIHELSEAKAMRDDSGLKHADVHQEIGYPKEREFRQGIVTESIISERTESSAKNYKDLVITAASLRDMSFIFNEIFRGEIFNEPVTASDLERYSSDGSASDGMGQANVRNDGRTGNSRNGNASQDDGGIGRSEQGDNRIPDNSSAMAGESRNNGVYSENGEIGFEAGTPRSSDGRGSGDADAAGVQPERGTVETVTSDDDQIVKRVSAFQEKIEHQKKANSKPFILNNKDNIADTLPILLSHQVSDVAKAEERFFGKDAGKGMMFTNGTGTGKTFTGLGIANRFFRSDKKNILIVVPTQQKVQDWVEDGAKLDLTITPLAGLKDSGKGVCVTTYANFGQNDAIIDRQWDLIVYDECHKLSANEQGKENEANRKHKLLSAVPSTAMARAQHFDPSYQEMDKRRKAYAASLVSETFALLEKTGDMGFADPDETDPEKIRFGRLRYAESQARDSAASKFRDEETKINKKLAESAKEFEGKTKVCFLSATPFSYHKSLDYADGCLFNINEGEDSKGESEFYINNFGYRMRYNKLTQPEVGVDQSLMERQFNEKLKKSGVLSSKRLELDQDYSRDFILLDAKIGQQIEEGLDIILGVKDRENGFKNLVSLYREKFNSLYTRQLLESVKTKYSIDRIKKHLSKGRKVIVFHSFMNLAPDNPFDFSAWMNNPDYADEINRFYRKYPQYQAIDLNGLGTPREMIKQAFGSRAVEFNGSVKQSLRSAAVKKFNEDDSNVDVIIVQIVAGKEGISLHDTTGKKQRVVYTLGLPTSPTDAIQIEGRAYRTGQKSNAIFEYPVIHTNFEKRVFREVVATRSKTAENLAMGDSARNLESAFKDGYVNAVSADPSDDQGIGGKDGDKYIDNKVDPFEIAKTHYWGRQKKTAATKSAEGKDYYATPEPLGAKMVEWAGLKPNESVLEPSAGHGAIARYFPENTKNVMIEPSRALSSDLGLIATGDVIESSFEDLDIVNKFDAIIMNPPFGTAGKQAFEHITKSMLHLKNGGRLIAIVPDGAAMNKRLEKLHDDKRFSDIYEVAEVSLPSVTFERSGTAVKTKVLIFDRQKNPKDAPDYPVKRSVDAKTIDEFFTEIKSMGIPERKKPTAIELDSDDVVDDDTEDMFAQDEEKTSDRGKFDDWMYKQGFSDIQQKFLKLLRFEKIFNKNKQITEEDIDKGAMGNAGGLFEFKNLFYDYQKVLDQINSLPYRIISESAASGFDHKSEVSKANSLKAISAIFRKLWFGKNPIAFREESAVLSNTRKATYSELAIDAIGGQFDPEKPMREAYEEDLRLNGLKPESGVSASEFDRLADENLKKADDFQLKKRVQMLQSAVAKTKDAELRKRLDRLQSEVSRRSSPGGFKGKDMGMDKVDFDKLFEAAKAENRKNINYKQPTVKASDLVSITQVFIESGLLDSKADYAVNGVKAKSFKNWFGDWEKDPESASKVVDKKTGEPKETFEVPTQPIVAYHGTAKKTFDRFDPKKDKGNNLYGKGFYFTEDKGVAESYTLKDAKIVSKIPEDKRNQYLSDFNIKIKELLSQNGFQDLPGKKIASMEKQFLKTGIIYRLSDYDFANFIKPNLPDSVYKEAVILLNAKRTRDNVVNYLTTKYGNDKAGIFSVFLKIHKPFDIDNGKIKTSDVLSFLGESGITTYYQEKIIKYLPSERFYGNQSAEDHYKDLEMAFELFRTNYNQSGKLKNAEKLTVNNLLQYLGYDGLTHIGGHATNSQVKHRVWIAFAPTQIKATENQGDFSPESESIYETIQRGRRNMIFEKDVEAQNKQNDMSISGLKPLIAISKTFGNIQDIFAQVFGSKLSTSSIPQQSGIMLHGNNGKTYLPDNTPIDFQYAIADISIITTSHSDEMYVNKDFPQELQPRERDRAGMQIQIAEIANKLNPERLADSSSATSGAPIANTRGVVESGNGRTMAIRRAYKLRKADAYRQWLIENAGKFGFKSEDVGRIESPILIRIRLTEVDAIEFTKKANQGEIATMSPVEVAKSDAGRITEEMMSVFQPNDDGYLGGRANKTFINRFLQKLGTNEAAGLLTADGNYTRQLLERVQSAIFHKAYRDDSLLALIAEEANPAIRNVLTALTVSAGDFMKAASVDPTFDGINIPSHVIAAAKLIKKAREEEVDIEMLIGQVSMFDAQIPEETKTLARFLAGNIRSGKKMGKVFKYSAMKLNEHLMQKNQTKVFGEISELTPSELIDNAIRKMEEETNSGKNSKQSNFFESYYARVCELSQHRTPGRRAFGISDCA